MTASFGGLDNQTLLLEPGLNILEVPNEGGKSTWSAFVAAMFYGIDSAQRDRRGCLADKNRYTPWGGAPMEGSLECVVHGRELILERGGKRAGAPMSQFSARYKDTGEPVPGLTGENAGLMLLGIEREVFLRSAMIRQSGLAVDQSPELERRIAALVSSGEEVSWSETAKQLQGWQNRRRHNKTGLLPGLEAELAEIDAQLSGLSSTRQKIARAGDGLEAAQQRIAYLEGQLALYHKQDQQAQNRRLRAAREELEEALRAVERIRAALQEHGAVPDREALLWGQETLRGLEQKEEEIRLAKVRLEQAAEEADRAAREPCVTVFAPRSPEEAWQQATWAADRCRALEKPPTFRPGLFGVFCGVALAALAGALLLARGGSTAVLALLLAASGFLAVFPPIFLFRWYKRRTAQVTERSKLLAEYGVKKPEEILELAAKYRETAVRADQNALRAKAEADALRDLEAGCAKAWEGLFAMVNGFAPEAQDAAAAGEAIARGLRLRAELESASIRLEGRSKLYESVAALGGDPEAPEASAPAPQGDRTRMEAELEQLRREVLLQEKTLAMAKGEQLAQGDPAALAARREEVSRRVEALEQEYRALSLAQSALRQAHETLSARFSPALNRRAGEIMQVFTKGKYREVLLDRSFAAAVRTGEEAVSRPSIALSQGTSDQLYLAVRLAICDLALPTEDRPPLILDDALSNFDDERMAAALGYLRERAKKGQILLFTCHNREARCLASLDDIGGMKS